MVADVSNPIIGSDFLAHYHLLPDCANRKIVDGETGLSNPAIVAPPDQLYGVKAIIADHSHSPFYKILSLFPNITRPPGLPRQVKHETVHFINTTDGPPVSSRPRRLAPQKLKAAQKEFTNMVQAGTATPSSSPWSSPLHLAPKKDATWRPCGDYRALNARTIPDRYPVRHIGDLAHNLRGATVFSTIDLVKAYQQIPVHPPDICKTAIITTFGLFEFPYMSFGLRNAGQTFQRFIDEVTRGLDFVFPYVDDILVFSRDKCQHEKHLHQLFQRLEQYGVVINCEKCVLGANEVTFLGYSISSTGIKPPAHRVEAIKDFPLPKTAQGLRRFLGMLNYYRQFIPKAAQYQAPLIDVLSKNQLKGAKPVPWSEDLEIAFQKCKMSLTEATMLAHPAPDAPLGLFTDASSTHIGATLQQKVDGDWQPLAFFSKKLSPQQTQWPAYYRELLAVYESVQHFRHVLEVQHATIYTDHKPLLYAFVQRREKLPPPQLNQLSFIGQFTTDIKYIKGEENIVADAMSRIEAISFQQDHQALATSQEHDQELADLRNSSSSLRLSKMTLPGSDTAIFCDVSTGKPRPYLTLPFRRAMFDQLHNLSHPGIRATTRLLTDRFVWPSIKKDCKQWSRTCLACQRSKVSRHNSAPLGTFNQPSGRFTHVHVDIIGPLPVCDDFRYCLTAIDRVSRWPEVWPMRSITAEEVADTFTKEWISRFGVPSIITTDQGSQFESELFRRLMIHFATKRIRTTSYHPSANGMIERVHRQLKGALMCHDKSWVSSLPFVLLGMRTAFKEDLKATAAELLYGENLRLPGEMLAPVTNTNDTINSTDFVERLRHKMANVRPVPASRHTEPSTFIFKNLASASHVFLRDDTVRRPLQPPYTGPHPVLERAADGKTLTISIKGKRSTVSVDRIKPAFVDHDESNNREHDIHKSAEETLTRPVRQSLPMPAPAEVSVPESRPYITRAGRHVKFKDKNDYIFF